MNEQRVGRWSQLAREAASAAIVGVGCGVASALFLHALEWATQLRERQPQLVFALPLAGLALGWVYAKWGDPIRGGNNLVLDTLHDARAQLPLRMGPMVLIGTVATHLFGGSAGREGTAVQMGASLADAIAHRLRIDANGRRVLLVAGLAAGFGSVFGTPIAGAVFGVEVLALGRLELRALLPALVAALVGDRVTRALRVIHADYPVLAPLGLDPVTVGKWAAFAVVLAMVVVLFIEASHRGKALLDRIVPRLPLRMAVGGVALVLLWRVVGSDRYLGLGVSTILTSFAAPPPPAFAFALKLVFTVLTLSAGFLGGEVTPLFFIGGTLGSAIAPLLRLPQGMAAGVGMAAMFGVAANVPIALSVMAVELFGGAVLPHVFLVSVFAYVLSGHRGIYGSQRLGAGKQGHPAVDGNAPLSGA